MAQRLDEPDDPLPSVSGVNHFSILAPANELIAAKILSDEGPSSRIAFTEPGLTEIGRR